MTGREILINIEDAKMLLTEIIFLRGYLCALEKRLPEMPQLNKLIEQLK